MIEIVEPTLEGLGYIAKHLRKVDRVELGATSFDIEDSVLSGAAVLGVKRMVLVDGVPVFAGGLVPVGPGIVQGWGFGTDDARKATKAITKEAKRIINTLKGKQISRAQALCLARSEKWLRAIGLENASKIGKMNGRPFLMMWGEW